MSQMKSARVMTVAAFMDAIGEHKRRNEALAPVRYRAYRLAYEAPTLLALVLMAIHAGANRLAVRAAASDRDAGRAMIECPRLTHKEEG